MSVDVTSGLKMLTVVLDKPNSELRVYENGIELTSVDIINGLFRDEGVPKGPLNVLDRLRPGRRILAGLHPPLGVVADLDPHIARY